MTTGHSIDKQKNSSQRHTDKLKKGKVIAGSITLSASGAADNRLNRRDL